jgi:hypothetical protein
MEIKNGKIYIADGCVTLHRSEDSVIIRICNTKGDLQAVMIVSLDEMARAVSRLEGSRALDIYRA